MSAAYDNSVQAIDFAVTTITTGSFTISGSDRAAMVCLSAVGNPGAITSMSCGGQSGSAVSGAAGDDATWWHNIYRVIAPATGTQTASATWANALVAMVSVITATGCNQTTPVNNGNYAEAASATVSVSITSTSGDLTATFSGDDLTGVVHSTNQTIRLSGAEIGADTGPGTGTTNHQWTHTGAFASNVAGANFVAAGGAAAALLPFVIGDLSGIGSPGRLFKDQLQ